MGKNKKKEPIKTRDYFMVEVIKGVTKAGVHVDQKKKENKLRARKKVRGVDDV